MTSSDEDQPKPHPEPPQDLATRQLSLIEMDQCWFRIHQTQYSPLYYGRSSSGRFNAPAGEYGVMYLAEKPQGAFIETLGSETGIRLISEGELLKRCISTLSCQRSLKLIDLTGAGLAHIGADARLCSGDHKLDQRWLWQHPAQIDGIYYRARHDQSQYCAVIFDRAQSVFEIQLTQGLFERSFQGKLADILDDYDFGLIQS
jgi:hypothetical protein